MDAEDSLFTGSDSEAQDQVVMHSEDADEQWDELPENPVREKSLPTDSEETDELQGEGESLPMVIDFRNQSLNSGEVHSQDKNGDEQPDDNDTQEEIKY